MQSVIDAWREQIMAHERDASALRGGETHGHGHGDHAHSPGGHGGFAYSNRPQDPYRTDDPVLNSLFAAVGPDTTVLDVGGGARPVRPTPGDTREARHRRRAVRGLRRDAAKPRGGDRPE